MNKPNILTFTGMDGPNAPGFKEIVRLLAAGAVLPAKPTAAASKWVGFVRGIHKSDAAIRSMTGLPEDRREEILKILEKLMDFVE